MVRGVSEKQTSLLARLRGSTAVKPSESIFMQVRVRKPSEVERTTEESKRIVIKGSRSGRNEASSGRNLFDCILQDAAIGHFFSLMPLTTTL